MVYSLWRQEGTKKRRDRRYLLKLATALSNGFRIAACEGRINILKRLPELTGNREKFLHSTHAMQALQCAYEAGHTDAVKWLIKRGALEDEHHNREFFLNCFLGKDYEMVDHLLDTDICSERLDCPSWNPLFFAVWANDFDMVEWLLGSSADIDVVCAPVCRFLEFKGTALHVAIARSQSKMVRLLLDWGSDPSIPDQNGHSSVLLANRILKRTPKTQENMIKIRRAKEIVKLLSEAGAVIQKAPPDQCPPNIVSVRLTLSKGGPPIYNLKEQDPDLLSRIVIDAYLCWKN